MTVTKRLRLGEILTRSGSLSEPQLQVALARQQVTREPIGEILVSLGFVTSGQIRNALELQYGVRSVSLASILNPDMLRLLPPRDIRRLRAVPVAIGQLSVAMVDPGNVTAIEELKGRFKGVAIQPVVVTEAEFADFLIQLEGAPEGAQADSADDGSADLTELLAGALARRAAEILLEPGEAATRVRLHIDGHWREQPSLLGDAGSRLIARLQLMCNLRPPAGPSPQTGSFVFPCDDRSVKVTYHGLPVRHGQVVTLRLFDPEGCDRASLDALVANPAVHQTLLRLLARRTGLILLAGPAHKLKSALLHACLHQLAESGRTVVSLEPEVEVEIPAISQVQVGSEESALGLRTALESALEHAHEAIAIRELGDPATARAAVRAALGGRLVLAGWNTTEPDLDEALRAWGLPARTVAGALAGIVNVRVVRALCAACRTTCQIPEDIHPLVAQYDDTARLAEAGPGCEECSNTGYRGEIGIFEVFPFDRNLRLLVAAGAAKKRLDEEAKRQGLMPLLHFAAYLVASGQTSWEEVSELDWLED